jgi:hypothetical protein
MLKPFRDGVWCESGPVRFLGLRLTATMTVLRLNGDELLVHSPLPLTAERRAQVTALGCVAHLYAPNTFHHSWLGEWAGAFPEARVHAPHELKARRPDLRIDRFHDQDGQAAFEPIEEIPIRGFRLRETVLVYRPGRTAIVTDLVHNIGRPEHAWTRFYTRTMGFYDRVALSRILRWTAFDDRGAARRSVDALLDRAFDGLIVGHGAPIADHGRELLAAATAWLPEATRPRLPSGEKSTRLFSAKPCG